MTAYGTWKESLSIDGRNYRADLADDSYARRAGFRKIYAVDGLPPGFEDSLVRASQVSDVPHTWRVQECSSEEEVTPEILERGREALRRDMRELRAHIFTYIGDDSHGGYEFLAAGAVRDKLTRAYQNEEFPVVSRAIVAPKHRGKRLGTLIVEHRVKLSMRYFDKRPKAIHFGTESKKILQSIKKAEADEGIKFVYIGDERYTSADGTHTVHDYLSLMPWYTDSLIAAAGEALSHGAAQADVAALQEGIRIFAAEGVTGIRGRALESRFQKVAASVNAAGRSKLAPVEELFFIKTTIGAEDPA